MRKLTAIWVLHLLTIVHKGNRVTTLKQSLALFKRNKNEFHERGRNVYSTQHTEVQAVVETMGFAKRIGSKKGKIRPVRQ